jgi:hypothetical protein
MVNGFFDNLFTDAGVSLATAVNQARRKLRAAFSLGRYFNVSTQTCLQEELDTEIDDTLFDRP